MFKQYLVYIISFILLVNFVINLKVKNKTTTKAHFELTCTNLKLRGSILFGECTRINGELRRTYVDLNTCVSNLDGYLVSYGDKFYNTCNECELSGVFLICLCRQIDFSYIYTSLNLSLFVDNDDGNLKC